MDMQATPATGYEFIKQLKRESGSKGLSFLAHCPNLAMSPQNDPFNGSEGNWLQRPAGLRINWPFGFDGSGRSLRWAHYRNWSLKTRRHHWETARRMKIPWVVEIRSTTASRPVS